MIPIKKIGVAAAVVCLAAIPLVAQNTFQGGRGRGGPFGPPGPGIPALERLDRELGLSDAQKSQIESMLTSERDTMRTTMGSLRQAEQALAAAVMQAPADDGAIQSRASELAAVQAQLTLARAQLESRIYQLLTPDQQQKAQQWVAQMQQHGGRRGGDR
jgi:Spy/CpxP family protein refolding chaperone